jgi:hypothetical protein
MSVLPADNPTLQGDPGFTEVDAKLACGLKVAEGQLVVFLECDCFVDRTVRSLAGSAQEVVFDYLISGGQYQLQVRCGHDIEMCRPEVNAQKPLAIRLRRGRLGGG